MSTRYTATIKLEIPQFVQCAHCDAEYVYEMTVTGIGNAESGLLKGEKAAEKAAEKDALENLVFHLNDQERLLNAIPCRRCHLYQPYMHKALGLSRYAGPGCFSYIPLILGFLTFVGAVIAWFVSKPDRSLATTVGLCGLAAWLLGYVAVRWVRRLEARYDGNREDLAAREKLAAERAMTFAAFDELQASRLRAAYNEHRGATPAAPANQAKPWRPDPNAPQARVFEWWVTQSALTNGDTITVSLSDTETATVAVPEDAPSGSVFEMQVNGRAAAKFKVRVSAVYVHQGEMRLE